MNRWNSQILVPQGLESLEKRKAIRNNQVTNDKVQIGQYLAILWANFFKLAPWFFFLLIYHWTKNYTVDLTLKYFKWTFLHLAQNTWFAGTECGFYAPLSGSGHAVRGWKWHWRVDSLGGVLAHTNVHSFRWLGFIEIQIQLSHKNIPHTFKSLAMASSGKGPLHGWEELTLPPAATHSYVWKSKIWFVSQIHPSIHPPVQ